MSTTPHKASLAELVRRVERLEDAVSPIPLLCCQRRGVPGFELTPETDLYGNPIPYEDRVMWVRYPGQPSRPLRPGELDALRRRFGDRLRLPFLPRIGDAIRGSRRDRHDDGDDD